MPYKVKSSSGIAAVIVITASAKKALEALERRAQANLTVLDMDNKVVERQTLAEAAALEQ